MNNFRKLKCIAKTTQGELSWDNLPDQPYYTGCMCFGNEITYMKPFIHLGCRGRTEVLPLESITSMDKTDNNKLSFSYEPYTQPNKKYTGTIKSEDSLFIDIIYKIYLGYED